MSKIIKNQTASPIDISDTGVTIPASGQYTIPAQDYLLWAASDDIIIEIGTQSVVVNDGSTDLGISDGTDLIKGLFPSEVDVNLQVGGTALGRSGDSLKVTQNNTSDTAIYTKFDPRSYDAIGRFRVSEPRTLFELTAGEGLDTDRYIDVSTTGTATVVPDSASTSAKLSVSASGDLAITQTRRRIQYAVGSSQFILVNARFETPTANIRQRRGYFSNTHGLFFEIDGTSKYIVRRTSLSGSTVDTRIAQSSWNVDPLDGTGPSSKTWDCTKQTSYAIDFVWDNPIIRYYISMDGEYVLVHVDNSLSGLTAPFMETGMAPLRSEMEATGSISGTYSSYTTSAVVASEGNEVTLGRVRNVDTGTSPVSVSTSPKVVAGIRLKSSKINGALKPIKFNLNGVSGNNYVYYRVIYNPTLTGDTWADLTGLAQGLANNPSFTGGSVIDSGYLDLSSKGKVDAGGSTNIESDIYVGSDIAGNADALILVIETTSGSGSILFSGQYREFF